MSSIVPHPAKTNVHAIAARLLTRQALLAALMTLIGGALCGEAGWWALVQARAEAPPPGWGFEPPRVPYQLTDLAGSLEHHPDTWSLSHWRGIQPDPEHPHSSSQALEASFHLPQGGQIEIALGPKGTPEAVSVLLERTGDATTRLLLPQGHEQREHPCTASLPAPGDELVELTLRPGHHELWIGMGDIGTTCALGFSPSWQPTLRPGLVRIHLSELTLDGEAATPQPLPARPLAWLLASCAAMLLVVLELAVGARASIVALTSLPLLAAGLLAGRDASLWAETVRAVWLPVRWLPALGPLLASLCAKATHHLGRSLRGWPWRGGLWTPRAWAPLTLWIALTIGLLAVLGDATPGSLSFAALLALAWAVLVWANANATPLRWYNATCLAASIMLVVATEGWLRNSPANSSWSAALVREGGFDIMSAAVMAGRDFESIDQAEHTTYPDRGYPVAIPPGVGLPRVVAMGGSTTGGAWQNDDLDEFYPARLSAYLGADFQVINQGVGGWTTWHVRHYLARGAMDALKPDVLLLYVGHNDLLTPAPLPYAQLYERWLAGGTLASGSSVLNRFRIYQGVRYGLVSLSRQGDRVAVPAEHARDNLAWISGQVVERGGRVILVTEGLSPDPAPMQQYNSMMAELASSMPGVEFIDAADAMHEQPGSGVFLDDCHLTPQGHDLLAQLVLAKLMDIDFITDPPAQPPPVTNDHTPRMRDHPPRGGPLGPGPGSAEDGS